jgi:hypothetical protein
LKARDRKRAKEIIRNAAAELAPSRRTAQAQ